MLKIDDYRKQQEKIRWQQQAEAAWAVFVASYPAYNLLSIKGFMLDDENYWHGDDVDTQGLLDSIPYHEAAGHFRAMPDEWVERRQLEAAEEAEEARKQRKGTLIRELLGLQKEHVSPATYGMLTSKYQIWDVPQLEAELQTVIYKRELDGASKKDLHKIVKKGNTPAPDMSRKQIPTDITPSLIKRMSSEQIKQLNIIYGPDLVNERLGVVPRLQVGGIVTSSDRRKA
jgi:hypothetical protein